MDALDEASAVQFQAIHNDLQNGFWNTGQLGAKGTVVEEPVNVDEQTAHDSIRRYTDKYLPRRQIGHTTADFDFEPLFLPKELYKAAGVSLESASNDFKPVKSDSLDVAGIDQLAREEDNETGSEKDEEAEPIEEDEFEELEDDDYNAEKYFDHGEDYGDGDDGEGEAAY